jgi:hypothetical protein
MIVAIAVSRMFARWYALRARGGAA